MIWGGEFGRTPTSQGSKGRDHNSLGFIDVAGRRRRQGRHTSTARPTSSAAPPSRRRSTSTTCTPPSCTCWASTTRRLTYRYSGRDFRLTDVHGEVVRDILA